MDYKTEIGDQVIIWITGMVSKYIAEVTSQEPLKMKVEESGPYATLKDGDFIVLRHETEIWQEDGKAKQAMLRAAKKRDLPFLSGLASFGITDDQLHEILPGEPEEVEDK